MRGSQEVTAFPNGQGPDNALLIHLGQVHVPGAWQGLTIRIEQQRDHRTGGCGKDMLQSREGHHDTDGTIRHFDSATDGVKRQLQ
jgi:hypothetical protein